MTPPTASANPCGRPKLKLERKRAEVGSNNEVQAADGRPDVQRLDQPGTLLRCHICPKMQGTFLPVRTHIRQNHRGQSLLAMQPDQPDTPWRCPFCPVERGTFPTLRAHVNKKHEGQPIQLKCERCGFQTENPTSLRTHQAEAHKADTMRVIEPGNAGAAIPTTSDKHTTSRVEQLSKKSPNADSIANNEREVSFSVNNDENVSVDSHEKATVTVQKIRTFNFPPLNPENKTREDPDGRAKLTTTSITKTLGKTPDCIKPGAALPEATPATRVINTPKEIVFLKVEDMPIGVKGNISHIKCRPVMSPFQKKDTHLTGTARAVTPQRGPQRTLQTNLAARPANEHSIA